MGFSGVVAVTAGVVHTVALKGDGTVVAWGNNSYGQTTVPAGLSGVVAISAGNSHTVALKGDGTVVAWGDNGSDQAVVPAGLSGVVAISAGGSHAIALKDDGTVAAWGNNAYGQITVPAGLSGVVAISAGGAHSVAVKSDGTVVAWGADGQGQSTIPTGLSGVVAVSAGANHTIALKGDGTVVAWGYNEHGQTTVPAGLTGVIAVSAGWSHTIALKGDGTAVAWGNNNSGQATIPMGLSGLVAVTAGTVALKGDGTVAAWGSASVPNGLSGVVAVAVGLYHTVALKGDGTVVAWGGNYDGQATVPSGLSGVVAVSAGLTHTVALKSNGTVVAWGNNDYGQITVPTGLTEVVMISAGDNHTVALKANGTVVAWGNNNYGQTTVPKGLSGIVALSAGRNHTVALKANGAVAAWGDNEYDQTWVPTGLSGVVALSAGGNHTVALKSDGTVVAWGDNSEGQYTAPTGLSGVVAVTAGADRIVALKGDGTLVAWGQNNYVPYSPYETLMPGMVTWDPATLTATYIPDAPLPNSAIIKAALNQGIKTQSGVRLAADVTWDFSTALIYNDPFIDYIPLSNGYIGIAYYQTLTAAGGKLPYTWSIITGTLPAGLTMSSAGVISGTPTTLCNNNITFKVTDANGKTAAKTLSITIKPTPPTITTTTLPDGNAGVAYSKTLTATGGKSPYSWSKALGNLPYGMSLSRAGVISGTPSSEGTSNFTLQVLDSNNATGTAQLSINIIPVVSIVTTSLSNGAIGSPYNRTLQTNGGVMPFTWSIIQGALPPGLSLNTSTGVINGLPTVTGDYNITVQVKDANNKTAISTDFTMTINPPVQFATTKLHDSFVGAHYSHAIALSGGVPPYTFSILSGALPAGLTLDTSTGIISGTPTVVSNSSFTVQARDAGNATVSTPFTIAITDFGSISGTVSDSATGAPLPGVTAMLTLDFTGKNDNEFTCNGAALGALDYATISENDKNKYSCFSGRINTMKFNVRNPFGTDPFTIHWNGISGYNQGTEYLAQSFKPTKSGTLTKVSFYFKGGDSTDYLTLQLKSELGGDRGTQLAVSAQAVPDATSPWIDFIFETPVAVNAGQTYYLEIQGGIWYGCGSGYCIGTVEWGKGVSYSAGAVSNRSGGIWYPHTDTLAFKTFLDNQVDVAVLPSADGSSMNMSGNAAQIMRMSLYDHSAGNWHSGGTVDMLGPDITYGYEYNGDDLTINWPVMSGLEDFYDLNGLLTVQVDNHQGRWANDNPPSSNLLTDKFSLTFHRILTTVTDANGAYSFQNLPDGPYNITYYKTNYADNTASGTLSPGQNLNIASNLANYTDTVIATDSLADGYVGYYYKETLKATGNKAPYTWKLAGGNLPFTLTSDGSIYGNPSTAGRWNFTAQVTDIAGITMTKAFSILTYGNAWNISESTLPDASLGSAYNYSMTVIDATKAPFTWSIASGRLPAGLTLNSSTGAITGTPTAYDNTTFFVKLKDANNFTSFRQFSLYVNPPASVEISTSELPDAFVGAPYNQSLTVAGGIAPFTWSITSGSLPAGLSLNSNTGAITGTPTAARTSHFVVMVKDAYSQGTKSLAITVTTPPFTLRNLGDSGNVTIMEVTGNFDAKNADGSINDQPRKAISSELIRSHTDTYDFVVYLSTFDYALPEAGAEGFYLSIKNDVQGINQPIFDNSAQFGSNGKLQGTIDLGNVSPLAAAPFGPLLDADVRLLNHELMHRFGAYVRFKNGDGSLNTGLVGRGDAHWSYLLDTQGSIMYGNGWKNNGDGTFTSTSAQSGFSPLDLYLMGMIPKEQVPAMTLIDNSTIDKTQLPWPGATISGTAKTVTIDDIIAAEGARIPGATASQKKLNVGFVLLTRPGDNTSAALQAIETLRSSWAGRFAELTQGIGGIANVAASVSVTIDSPGNGTTITGPDVTVTGSVINSSGVETGVTVNGIVATVSGSRFIANHIPLQSGDNTITVTATDVNGLTATATRSVTVQPGNYIRISSIIESGVAPLDVSLRVDGSFSITNPTISASGPASITLTPGASATEFTTKLSIEGTYTITASSVGPDGQTYTDSVVVTVMSKKQLDTLLKAKWTKMKEALAAKDITAAVADFSIWSKNQYQLQYTALLAYLPQIAAEMGNITMVKSDGMLTEYDLRTTRNGTTYSFLLLFVKDLNGLWRIRNY